MWTSLASVSLLQAGVLVAICSSFSWEKLAARAQALVASGAAGIIHDEVEALGPAHHGVYEPLMGAAHV